MTQPSTPERTVRSTDTPRWLAQGLRLWAQAIRQGTAGHSGQERRRIQTTNLLTGGGMAAALMYAGFHLVWTHAFYAFTVNMASAVLYGMYFWLVGRGHPVFARGAAAMTLVAQLLLLVLVCLSPASNFHWFLALIGPGAFFLFEHRLARWACVLGSIGLFVLCESVPPLHLDPPQSEATYHFMQASAMPLVMSFMLLIQHVFLHDLSEHEEALEHAAHIDSLTQLLNRTTAIENAQTLLEHTRHSSQLFAVLMVDIDHFKHVNDRFGHAAGDLLLQRCAAELRLHLRHDDVIGRFGGEEFFLALRCDDLAMATNVAERLRQCVEKLNLTLDAGTTLHCTLSLGVACAAPAHPLLNTLDAFIRAADQALYQAKAAGRNGWVLYTAEPSDPT